MEMRYVDVNEDGDDLEYISKQKMPKWKLPTGPFQERLLKLFGRKYYPDVKQGGKDIRTRAIIIEKSMASVKNCGGKWPTYPSEWIDYCLEYVLKCRNDPGSTFRPGLSGVLTMIENTEKLEQWKTKWIEKNGPLPQDKNYGTWVSTRKGRYDE